MLPVYLGITQNQAHLTLRVHQELLLFIPSNSSDCRNTCRRREGCESEHSSLLLSNSPTQNTAAENARDHLFTTWVCHLGGAPCGGLISASQESAQTIGSCRMDLQNGSLIWPESWCDSSRVCPGTTWLSSQCGDWVPREHPKRRNVKICAF